MNDLKPQPTNWRSRSGSYNGSGTIFSESLQKPIEGKFTVQWDEFGELSIECDPVNASAIECLKIVDDFDNFSDLKVTAEAGTFSAECCYFHGPTLSWNEGSFSSKLRFSAIEAVYEVAESEHPSIWNTSLTNFLMDIRTRPGIAAGHPCRIYRPSAIPDDLPEAQLQMVTLMASSKDQVVPFQFSGVNAFIEHLADYEAVKAELTSRRSSNRVTSVMYGDIPNGMELTPQAFKKWFPADVLFGLTFASGSRIGMGPIELRDQDGKLCKRIHLFVGSGRYTEGHLALSDLIHSDGPESGLGPFLTGLLRTGPETMRRLRLLAWAINLAQEASETPDHAYAFIVRALDGLANDLKISRSNLRSELPAEIGDQITRILKNAWNSIRRLSGKEGQSVDARVGAVINRIAERARAADSTDDKFGLSLGRVLRHYRLNDEVAMNSFYEKHPRPDGFGWTQVLDIYRGATIHQGFIDYDAGIEIMDVVCCTKHLTDIAMRICLRESEYSGTYNPFNMAATQMCVIDWVQSDKDVEQFGFHGMRPKAIRFVEVR